MCDAGVNLGLCICCTCVLSPSHSLSLSTAFSRELTLYSYLDRNLKDSGFTLCALMLPMALDAHPAHEEPLAVSEFPVCRHWGASHMKIKQLLSQVERRSASPGTSPAEADEGCAWDSNSVCQVLGCTLLVTVCESASVHPHACVRACMWVIGWLCDAEGSAQNLIHASEHPTTTLHPQSPPVV